MQWRAMPCSLQVCRLHACNTTQSCWVDLKLDSIYGTFTSCYYTAHHLDILQGECVLAACSIILSLMLLIISNNCLRAERQSSHLFRWHIKACWRAVPDSNVYTKLCDVPTGHWKHCRLFNGAVYWWQPTVSLPLYDSELGKISFSWKDGGSTRRRYHLLLCTLVPHSVPWCTQVTGQHNLSVHVKSRSADKLVEVGSKIALIYCVITEFCCGTDMPWLSVSGFLCMVNNNEAVRSQKQADRSDVTGGVMCVVAYLM